MIAGAMLVGAIEAMLDEAVRGARAHVEAALLAGALGLVLGVLAAVVMGALRRHGGVARIVAWLHRSTSRDRTADRQPVLRLHAVLIAALVPLAVWIAISRPLLTALLSLQEEDLAVALAIALSSSMIALEAWCVSCARWLERPLAWVDRRWPLPLPPWAGVRYALYVAAPVFVLLLGFARRYGDLLGMASKLLALPLVVVGAGLVAHAWRRVRPSAPRARNAAALVLLGVWFAGVLVVARQGSQAVTERSSSPAGALGALVVRPLTLRGPARVASEGEAAPVDSQPSAPSTFLGLPASASRKYNVVWVIIDAMRADRLGASRRGQSITPNLDRLANESVVFTRAYSQAAATSYAIPSMLTGRNVDAIAWEWAHQRPQLPSSEVTLAERLAARGYQSALVVSQFISGSLKGLQQGYQKTSATAGDKKTSRSWAQRTSPIASARSLSIIGSLAPGPRADRPFFLTVYYGDPHSPYINHEEFGDRFPNTEPGRYDAEIAFVDLHLGQLIDYLRIRSPLWNDTILIVTADHGEEFGEHGRKRHGHSCHVESVHVPLILRVPGLPPARVDTPVALVDLVPTLIELVGAPRDGADALSGSSLLIPLEQPARVDRRRAILSTAAHQRSNQAAFLARCARQDGFALFHRQRGDTQSWALFHTDEDPREAHDVSSDPAHGERLRRMQQLLASSLTGNIGQPALP